MSEAVSTAYQDAPTTTVDVGGTRFAYRELGVDTGVPVVLLHHMTGVLDDWDPRVVNGLATQHRVITFDNRGVGASQGRTPNSVAAMARDAIAFIRALGFGQVDLLGLSLGGFVAQEILQQEPHVVRRLILAGTGPAGGRGMDRITSLSIRGVIKSALTFKDAKHYLFFTQTASGQVAARQFLERLKERTNDRDKAISLSAFRAQLKAVHSWGLQAPADLTGILHPVFVVNGDSDRMVPSSNSFDLAARLPNARLRLYGDAGHAGIFQYHEVFVKDALDFLVQ